MQKKASENIMVMALVDCYVFNIVFNISSVIPQPQVHLSMLPSLNQLSTKYFVQTTGYFPT